MFGKILTEFCFGKNNYLSWYMHFTSNVKTKIECIKCIVTLVHPFDLLSDIFVNNYL